MGKSRINPKILNCDEATFPIGVGTANKPAKEEKEAAIDGSVMKEAYGWWKLQQRMKEASVSNQQKWQSKEV